MSTDAKIAELRKEWLDRQAEVLDACIASVRDLDDSARLRAQGLKPRVKR